jgi:hypothetical protein
MKRFRLWFLPFSPHRPCRAAEKARPRSGYRLLCAVNVCVYTTAANKLASCSLFPFWGLRTFTASQAIASQAKCAFICGARAGDYVLRVQLRIEIFGSPTHLVTKQDCAGVFLRRRCHWPDAERPRCIPEPGSAAPSMPEAKAPP